MKEIIVREGFLPRQPWQAKRRTIGRVPGQQGTEKKVLCDPLRGIFAKRTSQLRVRARFDLLFREKRFEEVPTNFLQALDY